MEDSENPTPEDNAAPPDPEPPVSRTGGAGRMIREAREGAGISIAKLCANLRISPATLEALEAGEYGKLAGAPYVRAMLVSLSRHLRLDAKEILRAYADESGGQAAPAVQVSPYKDDSGTHTKAHKQIFILLLAVLLFILLLIMGKVNTSEPDPEPEAPPAVTDTLLNIEPGPEYDPLPEDSSATDSAVGNPPPGEDPEGADAEDAARETRVRLTGLADSVWVRILPAGAREVSEYLRANRPLEISHNDAITFITRQGRSVRVGVGDTVMVPARRRFKVDGDQITY